MDQSTARQTLAEVEALRRRTRSILKSNWYPIILFGLLTALSGAIPLILPDEFIGLYWLLAGTSGSVLVARYYRRREETLGLSDRWLPYAVVGGSIIVGTMVVGALGRGDVAVVGPSLVVAAGYLAFSLLDRRLVLAVLAFAMAAVALTVAATDPPAPYTVLSMTIGWGMVVTGLGLRRCEVRDQVPSPGRAA
ncbi:MAG: hypothetical protein ACT4OS_04335 [Acidimicrobiales bacterium]